MADKVGSEQYWRARAIEARAQADSVSLPSAKETLHNIAALYERLAAQEAARTAKKESF